MITVVRQEKPFQQKWCDFAIGDYTQVIRGYDSEELKELNMLRLQYIDPNPWRAIARLVNLKVLDPKSFKSLHDNSKYECPYTDNEYTGLVPLAIFSNDLDKYFPQEHKPWYYEMAVDKTWNCEGDYLSVGIVTKHAQNPIIGCVYGPGYTPGTMINDGNSSTIAVLIDLSNGDKMSAISYVWHNK